MRAGKRTQAFMLDDIAATSPKKAASEANVRHLRKSHLGGVIFGCKNSTLKECLFKQLFGLPAPHFSYVKNIDPGLPLFLFNYSDRKLHGIFESASSGKMNIDPYGWTADGSQRTLYPAQVQVRLRLQCQALREDQFKAIIIDNYYNVNHFWFELDHSQTNKLMDLLSSLAVAPSTSAPQNMTKWRALSQDLPPAQRGEDNEVFEPPVSNVDSADFHKSNKNLVTSDVVPCFSGNNQPPEAYLDESTVDEDEKDLIYMKLKEMALNRDLTDSYFMQCVEDTAILSDVNMEQKGFPNKQTMSEKMVELIPLTSSDYPSVIAQLIQEMKELNGFKTEQNQKMEHLEQKLVEAETEIQHLKHRCMMLESRSSPSVELFDERTIESSSELHMDLDELIFLVGGYDGEKWLLALDSYSPSQDKIYSLQPMYSARSYASVAKLNGELYVFGGGNGSLWYDTVESYNPANNEWTLRPSLNRQKGSLAGATLENKIYALGGGNGRECFSDVEMLDLDVGRWISTQSMLQQRFALAATELNGAIYAVGGFDGKDYLK